MNQHKEKLVLRHDNLASEKPYTVGKIINSTKYVPGDRLSKEDVDHRILRGWTVEVQ